jgi:3-hydroxyacyl-CoA dehydrogenase/enoyl-CoA hydratase/3-hydroxybutyryl-CoA epimerase
MGKMQKDFMTTTIQQNRLKFEANDAGIVTLWLDGGGRSVVVLDRNLIQRLHTTLDAIEQLENIKGLILRSACDRVFVAGADLEEIDSLDDHALHAYLAFGTTVFGKIAALPFPTVACISGAALGGGLEVAMHCDGLIASRTTSSGKPYAIGLPEAGLGLCPGWGGSQMLPARMEPSAAMIATATGAPFMISNLPSSLIDVLVDTPEQLQESAESWLQSQKATGTKPKAIEPKQSGTFKAALEIAKSGIQQTEASDAVFQAIDTGIREGWNAAVAVEQCELVRLRNTTSAREKLDAFLSKG